MDLGRIDVALHNGILKIRVNGEIVRLTTLKAFTLKEFRKMMEMLP
jgi:uncharacterized protein with GYD domain